MAKTSIASGAHVTTAGADAQVPPRSSSSVQRPRDLGPVRKRPVVGDPEEVEAARSPRAGREPAPGPGRLAHASFSSIGFTSVTKRVIVSSS